MNRLLIQLFAPPVIWVMPWLLPAYQKRWISFMCISALWVMSLLIAITLWFGPGVIGLVVLGAVTALTGQVDDPRA
jgi:hypothetical protein